MWQLLVVGLLIAGSALFSGLTIGLMKLSLGELRRKAKLGNKNALAILPLRQRGNLLLVTLLLGNVALNVIISILLGNVASGLVATLAATGLIVIFGEIMPMAAFNRHAMTLSARLAWFVRLFMIVLYPIAKPISMILDRVFGTENPVSLSYHELSLLLQEQSGPGRSQSEQEVIEYAVQGLALAERTARSAMKPRKHVFMLNASHVFTQELLSTLKKNGYSRVPVFHNNRSNIVGLLYTKDIAFHPDAEGMTIEHLMRRGVIRVSDKATLSTVLRRFKQTKQHLFIVSGNNERVLGIITLEDVVEEITGEIDDEHDE